MDSQTGNSRNNPDLKDLLHGKVLVILYGLETSSAFSITVFSLPSHPKEEVKGDFCIV
jgi:hypothetical protein